jgi:hypothetical protein
MVDEEGRDLEVVGVGAGRLALVWVFEGGGGGESKSESRRESGRGPDVGVGWDDGRWIGGCVCGVGTSGLESAWEYACCGGRDGIGAGIALMGFGRG